MKVGDFRAARAISSPVAAAWPRIPHAGDRERSAGAWCCSTN